MRKEIGGYIELEKFSGKMLHEDALALNCGRNALAYLIRARNIKKIKLPYFMCDSVINTCRALGVEVDFYHIDEQFHPMNIEPTENEWFYLVDFYGQLTRQEIKDICNTRQRVIVDYAQAYFEIPVQGVDSIYTCRKYFGVADGAFLYTDTRLNCNLGQDESFARMRFLMGRYERTASEFYKEYVKNNKRFANEPIMKMSKLTDNFLHGINYEAVRNRRTANYEYLDQKLRAINLLTLNHAEGAFAYPLLLKNGSEIRKKLIDRQIFVPTLWPSVFKLCNITDLEYDMALNILPLPVDQRYDKADMEYICECILECIH